ncbi:PH, RCC1 and FYVE domains-containing protein 1-like isoform X2 [Impatiens glandulifera]|nr:PH, RCC1 and FYVE domains-containing protein 1-like isoform X2 [Impatiens glandulifera]
MKYGRKGKPKFCPFRLSNDELSLIWISSKGERILKLASVSRIVPGQRTAVFQRYLRPEKEYLSFSLIHSNGKRSLDLICKDRVEAEVWIAGLQALIPSGQVDRSKIDGWDDGGLYLEDNGDLTSQSASDSSFPINQETKPPSEFSSTTSSSNTNTSISSQTETTMLSERPNLDVVNMQSKGFTSDVYRVSVSSAAPSTSSHGSAPDDCDALGDVYVWGEVICDNNLDHNTDKNTNSFSTRTDVLLPRPLESNVVLDVHLIACGVRHSALVSKQGELFTWGEASGGRLGHGVDRDINQPRLVESLAFSTVDSIACGEFHTCAVTSNGELYTWGDSTRCDGLLGHGSEISHWLPKRILGPLEGVQVGVVTCGTWHTALITSSGKLFTFGDGTFGALGHGDKKSVPYPKEVESLSGLRTFSVSCGVWHTAAIVEVIVTQSSSNVTSGKLFTWGDGDKNRLGHGDKDPRLKPTCVATLIDYNFQKISCGHSLTVGLTTSGRVITMGSSVYGQLGNPKSDGKLPCLVEDKFFGQSVEEVACGGYHVAVLTSRNEVYTWGRGANGRLGHGDVEDRTTPTLVEALKDRHVKFLACGLSSTAAICVHKWVSGAEQSQCSSCKQAFGFTRKRHNCYNCGLVHCHSCSSKKAFRAALAPNPNKLYRVCDSCFVKLNKLAEAVANSRRNGLPRLSMENKDKLDKPELLRLSNIDLIKQLDTKAAKQGKKGDMFYLGSSGAPSLLQLRDAVKSTAIDLYRTAPKQHFSQSSVASRAVSPFSRKASPPRSVTPIPTTSGLSFSKNIVESLKKANDVLNQEVQMLRSQVDSLRHRGEQQNVEVQKQTKKAQEATSMASEELAKCKAAKDVIRSLTSQLKLLAERLPPGVVSVTDNTIKASYLSNGTHDSDTNLRPDLDTINNPAGTVRAEPIATKAIMHRYSSSEELDGNTHQNHRLPLHSGELFQGRDSSASDGHDDDGDNNGLTKSRNHVESEWIEQYEPGVYITLLALHDGTRDLKRVRFSRRRFGEKQAETWWSENRERVYVKYNVRGTERSSSVSGHVGTRSDGGMSPSSHNT